MSSTSRSDRDCAVNTEGVWESVTVTRPNHPLSGQKVEILLVRGEQHDELVIKLADGTHAAVPRNWTDYEESTNTDEQQGGSDTPADPTHMLDIEGLRVIARLIQMAHQEIPST